MFNGTKFMWLCVLMMPFSHSSVAPLFSALSCISELSKDYVIESSSTCEGNFEFLL